MTGDELVQLRMSRGLKAKEMADLLGVSDATMSRYERGHRPIPKAVGYAAKYLCGDHVSVGERLVQVLREALHEEKAASQ